jgi:hypothetical protein
MPLVTSSIRTSISFRSLIFRLRGYGWVGEKGEDGAKRFNSLGHPTITFAVFVRVIAPDKRTALVTVFMHPRS